jgi:hypothetical protein
MGLRLYLTRYRSGLNPADSGNERGVGMKGAFRVELRSI